MRMMMGVWEGVGAYTPRRQVGGCVLTTRDDVRKVKGDAADGLEITVFGTCSTNSTKHRGVCYKRALLVEGTSTGEAAVASLSNSGLPLVLGRTSR
jgi:hypothetical protein